MKTLLEIIKEAGHRNTQLDSTKKRNFNNTAPKRRNVALALGSFDRAEAHMSRQYKNISSEDTYKLTKLLFRYLLKKQQNQIATNRTRAIGNSEQNSIV